MSESEIGSFLLMALASFVFIGVCIALLTDLIKTIIKAPFKLLWFIVRLPFR